MTLRRAQPVTVNRDSDVLVVGSGLAGMATALALAPRRVTLLTKTGLLAGGSSWWAQGGVAVVRAADDSADIHVADTLAAGDHANDAQVVRRLAEGGPEVIRRLIELGMGFDQDRDGGLLLAREGGHTRRRILHAGGDATGAGLVDFLSDLVMAAEHICVRTECFAWDLLHNDAGCQGLRAFAADEGWVDFHAPQVVLACGGIGQLYSHTTNPAESTGDALALAARAGVALRDIEYVQFHPTALASEDLPQGATRPLLTEALRGDGALLVDGTGRRFMPGLHELAELAPRDIVARAVWQQINAGNGAYLDTRAGLGDAIADKFPTVFNACMTLGLDPRREALPIAPAAHYHMGGVSAGVDGRTGLPGLRVVGEAACNGLHGANRMAGNSLLECLVFAQEVASAIKAEGRKPDGAGLAEAPCLPNLQRGDVAAMIEELRGITYRGIGLVRDARGLAEARAGLHALGRRAEAGGVTNAAFGFEQTRRLGELRNMLLSARLIARAANHHEGSRGAHFRRDFPERADHRQRDHYASATELSKIDVG